MSHKIADIKPLLQAQAFSLARSLAPDGYRSSNYWMARNPTRHDKKPGSFWIMISGNAAGGWRDEATGESGDVLGLIRYIYRLDLNQAVQWAAQWLGLSHVDPQHYAVKVREATEAQKRAEVEAKQKLEQDRRRAKAAWLQGQPIAGTIADMYLFNRGIDFSTLPRYPRSLRFLPEMRHSESGQSFPGMVAAMCNNDGSLGAIHRTYLAHDGSGKADVEPTRKIWPDFRGYAIHLWRGASGLPASKAQPRSETLVLCEGVEDGGTLAQACPEYRIWPVGSLGNLGNIVIPECAERVIVAADNDWTKPETVKFFNDRLEMLNAQGVPVHVARSPVGKDFNDCMTGSGR